MATETYVGMAYMGPPPKPQPSADELKAAEETFERNIAAALETPGTVLVIEETDGYEGDVRAVSVSLTDACRMIAASYNKQPQFYLWGERPAYQIGRYDNLFVIHPMTIGSTWRSF